MPSRLSGQPLPFAPLVLWAAVLFILSAVPGSSLPAASNIAGLDKVVHGVLYGIFGLLCSFGFWRTQPQLGFANSICLVTFAALAYGVSDEIHQIFVPARSADWHDVLADGCGGLGGAIAFRLALLRHKH